MTNIEEAVILQVAVLYGEAALSMVPCEVRHNKNSSSALFSGLYLY